jgi:hypothetical protein
MDVTRIDLHNRGAGYRLTLHELHLVQLATTRDRFRKGVDG